MSQKQTFTPKLIRDKIPKIIEESGKRCTVRKATIPEYQALLYDKMIEELSEFYLDPCLEEAADMYEVFLSILRHWGLDLSDVAFAASDKREARGGFRDGIILEKIAERI